MDDRKKKVYIASPYRLGDIAVNVKKQMDAADKLIGLGYVPFVPLYNHFQHMAHPRDDVDWLELDIEWLKVCDYVLRLGGVSYGADDEVKLAESLGIPVFYSILALIQRGMFDDK